jgi:hypothetical protein
VLGGCLNAVSTVLIYYQQCGTRVPTLRQTSAMFKSATWPTRLLHEALHRRCPTLGDLQFTRFGSGSAATGASLRAPLSSRWGRTLQATSSANRRDARPADTRGARLQAPISLPTKPSDEAGPLPCLSRAQPVAADRPPTRPGFFTTWV